MDYEMAVAIAKANLECYAKSMGFNEIDLGLLCNNKDDTWYFSCSIYKGEYGVSVTPTSVGFVVSVCDLSVTDSVHDLSAP